MIMNVISLKRMDGDADGAPQGTTKLSLKEGGRPFDLGISLKPRAMSLLQQVMNATGIAIQGRSPAKACDRTYGQLSWPQDNEQDALDSDGSPITLEQAIAELKTRAPMLLVVVRRRGPGQPRVVPIKELDDTLMVITDPRRVPERRSRPTAAELEQPRRASRNDSRVALFAY